LKDIKLATYKDYKDYVDSLFKVEYKKDGKKHYVYWVTDLRDGMHYIGRRRTKQDNLIYDFFKYGTSSKRKKDILKFREEVFKVTILRVFETMGEASVYESYLHEKFEVEKNPNFWNEARQGVKQVTFFSKSDKFTMFDNILKKYVKVSKEEYVRNKVRYSHFFEDTLSVRDKKTNEWVMVPRDYYWANKEQFLRNASGKIVATNLETGIRALYDKEEVEGNPSLFKKAASGTMTAIDNEGNTCRIPVDEYRKNRDKFKNLSQGKVFVTDLKTGEPLVLTKEEYRDKRDKGEVKLTALTRPQFVKVLDLKDKVFKKLPKEEFEADRERYKYCTSKEAYDFLGKTRIVKNSEE
jgi:hypothetical protein